MKRGKTSLIALLVVTLAIVGIWLNLPREPFSGDLTRIGDGTPAIVLAFENHTSPGLDGMEKLSAIRPDYAPQLHLLVADVSMPAAREVIEGHGAVNGEMMLFDRHGRHVGNFWPRAVEHIRHELAERLDLQPIDD